MSAAQRLYAFATQAAGGIQIEAHWRLFVAQVQSGEASAELRSADETRRDVGRSDERLAGYAPVW
jgi:hypothetical protein